MGSNFFNLELGNQMIKIIICFSFSFLCISYVKAEELIKTKNSALIVGEAFLTTIYGEVVLKQRPFKISSSKSSWILDGEVHCSRGDVCKGGTAHIEFSKDDGRIISYSHGK